MSHQSECARITTHPSLALQPILGLAATVDGLFLATRFHVHWVDGDGLLLGSISVPDVTPVRYRGWRASLLTRCVLMIIVVHL